MARAGIAIFLLAFVACTPVSVPVPAPAPVSASASASASVPVSVSVSAPASAPASASASAPAALSKVRAETDWVADPSVLPDERSAAAIERRSEIVRALFAQANVPFPPADLYFRAFKRERALEVWATGEMGGRMELIATYRVCALSGDLGPKRAEGDGRVPEGFYTLQYYWPNSAFHLEMKIGYPNASDRALSRGDPGGAIMIHGACASIGCLAMTDERIEELWTMATIVHSPDRKVHVHIFPTRAWDELLADATYAPYHAFWRNLKEGFDAFEATRRRPSVSIDWQGKYVIQAPRAAATVGGTTRAMNE